MATRATRLVMDWLAPSGAPLSIRTDSTNRASCRVAEKLGFEPTRVEARTTPTGDEYLETLYVRPVPDAQKHEDL